VARLAEVPGVTAILFGHSHGEFPGRFFNRHPKVDLARGTINGVPAVMPGAWGSHLGVIDLVLERREGAWQVADSRAEIRPVHDRAARKALVAPDPQIAALIKTEHEGTLAYVRAPVATTAPDPELLRPGGRRPFGAARVAGAAGLCPPCAGAPNTTGCRCCPPPRPSRPAAAAGWGYYTDIPAGPVAVRNVADLYIYPNTVKVVKHPRRHGARMAGDERRRSSTASTRPARPSRT
jgi:2',3'-cyclic-nucleotide 2'-phosphodiesterase/3'-nucleotidase